MPSYISISYTVILTSSSTPLLLAFRSIRQGARSHGTQGREWEDLLQLPRDRMGKWVCGGKCLAPQVRPTMPCPERLPLRLDHSPRPMLFIPFHPLLSLSLIPSPQCLILHRSFPPYALENLAGLHGGSLKLLSKLHNLLDRPSDFMTGTGSQASSLCPLSFCLPLVFLRQHSLVSPSSP